MKNDLSQGYKYLDGKYVDITIVCRQTDKSNRFVCSLGTPSQECVGLGVTSIVTSNVTSIVTFISNSWYVKFLYLYKRVKSLKEAMR